MAPEILEEEMGYFITCSYKIIQVKKFKISYATYFKSPTTRLYVTILKIAENKIII